MDAPVPESGSGPEISALCAVPHAHRLLVAFVGGKRLRTAGVISAADVGGEYKGLHSPSHPAAVPEKIVSNQACKSIFITLKRLTVRTFGY